MIVNRPLIAIDIGSSSVKVLEMGGANRRKLKAIGHALIPDGAVQSGSIQDQETVERTLRELLDRLNIVTAGRQAAVALSGSSLLIKKVVVTVPSDSTLEQQISYEAEEHLEANLADLNFDFFQLGEASDTGDVPVLLVAARKSIVEQYIEIVRSTGLRIAAVDCDAFAVANMFEYNYGVTDALIAIVNIGAAICQVTLIADGQYLYSREIILGGEDYSRQVAEALAIDRSEAEVLKVSASQGQAQVTSEFETLIATCNAQVVSEIQTAINFFFQGDEAPANLGGLRHIFMTGGGARTLGLDAALAAAMQVPVQIINPFQKVDINPKQFPMEYMYMQGHLYGVAVGLALRASNDKRVAA